MTRQLSSEFKRECAELVLNYSNAHKEAAKTMGVSISSIQRWVTQYRKERQGITPKNSALTPEQKRIQALEKQVKQLQSDNQLLKKASAFFAMEMTSGNK
ncbi:transposase [Orbus sasakiae]|uniref:Transposase n=1 Tax=Orbus sasakiae TaxID=1078475 RepID=A0ABP9NGD9_9GAMM